MQFNFGYYMVEIENCDISVLTKKYILEMQNELRIKIEKEPIYDENSG